MLLARQTHGNGLTDTRLYTEAGRLTNQFIGNPNSNTDTRVYSYDYNGNLTAKQTLPEVANYTYDPLNRLTLDADASPLSFTYDRNGNRNTGPAITTTYTPNTNRLATIAGQPITLSANGNVLTDPTQGLQYTYNNANELAQVARNNSLIALYSYNPEHLRISKFSAQGAILYHYDQNGHLIQETQNDGSLIKAYIWADDMPIAQITQTTTGEVLTYLHSDHQNTPRLATDPSGKVIWRYEGNAFGDTPPNEDPDGDGVRTVINLRFAGQYWDAETGLHYNWNRYYDPRLGRYITSDPIGLAGG